MNRISFLNRGYAFKGLLAVFIGKFMKKLGKMLKTNPLLMNLNPSSRNPGSAPGMMKVFMNDDEEHSESE